MTGRWQMGIVEGTQKTGDGRRTQQTEQVRRAGAPWAMDEALCLFHFSTRRGGRARRASKQRGGSAEEAKGRATRRGVPGISAMDEGLGSEVQPPTYTPPASPPARAHGQRWTDGLPQTATLPTTARRTRGRTQITTARSRRAARAGSALQEQAEGDADSGRGEAGDWQGPGPGA